MQLHNAVVVITGASSGIGRAAAHQFARHGARLVLAARSENLLHQIAGECAARGGSAMVVVTDVSDAAAVRALADQVKTRLGRIDVWINNAGVLAVGRLENIPLEDHEQVIRINLMGCLYGSRAAVEQFRRQGHGVLINTASMLGAASIPFASSYCASKWAIRGLTESVRMEVRNQPGIHACTLLPASIDTPIFRQAANYAGYLARAPEPVYSPERVAHAMVALAQRPRRERYVGQVGRLTAVSHSLAPALLEKVASLFIRRRLFSVERVSPTHGNLHQARTVAMPAHNPLIWDRLERPLMMAAVAAPLLLMWLRRRR